MSIYGLLCKSHGRDGDDLPSSNVEKHHYIPPMVMETADVVNISKSPKTLAETCTRKSAGVWGYALQIIFQVSLLLPTVRRQSQLYLHILVHCLKDKLLNFM